MAALQYVHIPGYSALILRRDYPRLALPNSIMDRARQWLYRTDAVWNCADQGLSVPFGRCLAVRLHRQSRRPLPLRLE